MGRPPTAIPVLLTRALTDAQRQLAHQLGLLPLEHPLQRLVPVHDLSSLHDLLLHHPGAAVAFTSAMGVQAVLNRPQAPNLQHRLLFAVGAATATALAHHQLDACYPPVPNAAELARVLQAHKPRLNTVLHPCSTQRRPELGQGLQQAGIEYVDVPVYAPEPAEPAGTLPPVKAVLLASPGAVQRYVELGLNLRLLAPAFAIGPTTGAALEAAGLPFVQSPEASLEALLHTAARHLNALP